MEKKLQLWQFTFYDFYAEIISGLKDKEAAALVKLMCEYMFTDNEIKLPQEDRLRYYYDNVKDILEEDKQFEECGKTPRSLNRKMKHFIFTNTFYRALKLMDDKQGGQYIKAICDYVFKDTDPQLKPPIDLHFTLARRKLETSKVRSKMGRKGEMAERVRITDEEITSSTTKSNELQLCLKNSYHIIQK